MAPSADKPANGPYLAGPGNVSVMLVGPSSVGKTDIALALAMRLGGEIVNADKFYLYRGFPSTTGLPDFSMYPDVPTHLYEILDPHEQCPSEHTFASDVSHAIDAISSRGAIPIVEGCYYRFSRAILNTVSERRWLVVGIKWPPTTNVASLVSRRVDEIFHDRAGIDEVRMALERGYRRTYVMREGSMVRPLVEYIDGEITLALAKEKAIAEIVASAYKALRKFLDLPDVTWYENDTTRTSMLVNCVVHQVMQLGSNLATSTHHEAMLRKDRRQDAS